MENTKRIGSAQLVWVFRAAMRSTDPMGPMMCEGAPELTCSARLCRESSDICKLFFFATCNA